MSALKVDVSSSSPCLWMEVSTDDFGKMFATMTADQQVAVLLSMVEHMEPWASQWDHISIELGLLRNEGALRKIKDVMIDVLGLEEASQ